MLSCSERKDDITKRSSIRKIIILRASSMKDPPMSKPLALILKRNKARAPRMKKMMIQAIMKMFESNWCISNVSDMAALLSRSQGNFWWTEEHECQPDNDKKTNFYEVKSMGDPTVYIEF